MNFFFKRYVIDYLIIAVLGLLLWIGSIWYFENYVPWTIGIVLFIFLVAYIPYVMHQDYKKVKDIWIDYQKMKSEEISKEQFHKNLLIKIADEIGIPEFISERILNKIIKEKPQVEVTA